MKAKILTLKNYPDISFQICKISVVLYDFINKNQTNLSFNEKLVCEFCKIDSLEIEEKVKEDVLLSLKAVWKKPSLKKLAGIFQDFFKLNKKNKKTAEKLYVFCIAFSKRVKASKGRAIK